MVAETQSTVWQDAERRVPDHPLTYEEFLQWTDGVFAEWVDGEVIYTTAASLPHTDISIFLTTLLRLHAEANDLGQVLAAPYQMYLRNVRRGREPDICFVAHANAHRLTHMYLDGPADLAVEIISPDSVRRDRDEKLLEYQTEGVREYWIIDPLTRSAQFYVLSDGQYQAAPVDDAGIYRSSVLAGFWFNVNWLWQQPLPALRTVLREYD